MSLFCEFIRIRAELRGTFHALWAMWEAQENGRDVRTAVLEALHG